MADQTHLSWNGQDIPNLRERAESSYREYCTPEIFKEILPMTEIRCASSTDNHDSIGTLTARLSNLRVDGRETSVATITVFPLFIETVGIALKNDDIGISALVGGYPVSHTYPEVRILECAMAVENGADEIEIIMDMGEIVSREREQAESEIAMMQQEIDHDALLKVTIDHTLLKDAPDIYEVARSVMQAGADFICNLKDYGSVDDIAAVCRAATDYHAETGRRVGIRMAVEGPDASQAVKYYTAAKMLLPPSWFDEKLVRFEGSAFLNDLLDRI